jgi:hypothetical protein
VLDPARLHVDLDPDAAVAEERERLVEGEARGVLRPVADEQPGDDVELDEVRARVDGRGKRLDAVLRRDGSRSAVADDERPRRAAAQAEDGPGGRAPAQMPKVVWSSRQAVSANRTVRNRSTAITTQKRALEFRAASARRLRAWRRARSRRYARSTALGSSDGASSRRVAGWATPEV